MTERPPDLRALALPVDEARLLHNLQGVRRRQVQRKIRRARIGASIASLAACALLAWFARSAWLPNPSSPGPLSADSADGTGLGLERLRALPERAERGDVRLDDGSRIHLAEHSRLELVENSGERVRSVLHEGWARFEVKPGGPRRWIVDAGLGEVQVVGTAFTVATSSTEMRVYVHHGRVLVRSKLVESGLVQLTEDEHLRLRAEPPRPVAPSASAAPSLAPSGTPSEAPAAASTTLRSGRPAAAASPAGSSGLPSALEQADALRAQGDPRRAAQLLARELWAHPGAEGLGLTALTLGQIQLDELHEPAQAARSFALAFQSRGLPPVLHEQALARQIQALARAGQLSTARARADEYARRYPSGTWLPALRKWLDGAP